MKISDLEKRTLEIQEASVVDNINRKIKDVLVALKNKGTKQLKTKPVIDAFKKYGIVIGYEEFKRIMKKFGILSDINDQTITFSSDDIKDDITDKENMGPDSEEKVAQLAQQGSKI